MLKAKLYGKRWKNRWKASGIRGEVKKSAGKPDYILCFPSIIWLKIIEPMKKGNVSAVMTVILDDFINAYSFKWIH